MNILANSETGILVDKVKLTIHNGKHTTAYGGNFDLWPAYPVDKALFKHDIPALYAQYVYGLTLTGIKLV